MIFFQRIKNIKDVYICVDFLNYLLKSFKGGLNMEKVVGEEPKVEQWENITPLPVYKIPDRLRPVVQSENGNPLVNGLPNDGKFHTAILDFNNPEDRTRLSEGAVRIVTALKKHGELCCFSKSIERHVRVYALPTRDETGATKTGLKFHVDQNILGSDARGIEGITCSSGMYACGDERYYTFPVFVVIKNWGVHPTLDTSLSLAIASNWTVYELSGEPISLTQLYEQFYACKDFAEVRKTF